MEIIFWSGLILLVGLSIYLAPKIVRKDFSFSMFTIIVLAFYLLLFKICPQAVILHAFLASLLLCCSGYVFLLKKKHQHNPDLLKEEEMDSESDYLRLRKAKILKLRYYQDWYEKFVIINIAAFILTSTLELI